MSNEQSLDEVRERLRKLNDRAGQSEGQNTPPIPTEPVNPEEDEDDNHAGQR